MIHRVSRGLITRRNMLATASGALIAAPFVRTSAQAQGKVVYVNSYGGVWETTWRKAFFDPFTAQTGIAIKTVPGVSFAKLKAQVQTGNYQWDVVNLGDVEYGQAVLENLLEKVDKVAAKTDQLPANMVHEYCITSYSLGTNIVYRKDKFPNGGPQSWADFWDVKRFRARAVCSTARSPASPSRCSPTACRPTSSIRWTSTTPSASSTRSSRTSRYGGPRATSRSS